MGNPNSRETEEGRSQNHAPVLVAYIPWVRGHDFVKGEETRIDGPWKFVCQGAIHRTNRRNLRSHVGTTSPPS